jgi:hypothetical protein
MRTTRIFWILLILSLSITPFLQAQDEEELPEGWTTKLSFGLDFSQLLQLNPKVGAGQNNFGFGGLIAIDATYNRNRWLWENGFSWQFGVQKVGSGDVAYSAPGDTNVTFPKVPFQKTVDQLRLGSKLGYSIDPANKWFVSGAFTLFTQTAITYTGPSNYPGNFLSNFAGVSLLNSSFFNPAFITLSAGIEYKPSPKFSFYLSPFAGKWIVVPDDEIALLGVHGNPVTRDADGNIIAAENVFNQFGALFRAAYTDQYWNERINFRSALLLYSNYLQNPQNIDVDWINELGIRLFGGFEISYVLTLFYDDDVQVQITDYDSPGGVRGVGNRISLTSQLLIKYSVEF